MTKIFVYLLLFGMVLYMLSIMSRRQTLDSGAGASKNPSAGPKPSKWFKSKLNPRELWVQVYETASIEEARSLQARIQEEEIECVIYEQGKKDIHGNPMTGIGVSVPKTAMPQAQRIISRMLS